MAFSELKQQVELFLNIGAANESGGYNCFKFERMVNTSEGYLGSQSL